MLDKPTLLDFSLSPTDARARSGIVARVVVDIPIVEGRLKAAGVEAKMAHETALKIVSFRVNDLHAGQEIDCG